MPATTRPNAVPANTMPNVGSISAHGSGPSEMPNATHPTVKSSTICTTPTAIRELSLAINSADSGAGIDRSRSSVPQSRSSRSAIETPSSIPRSRNVTLNPGTF